VNKKAIEILPLNGIACDWRLLEIPVFLTVKIIIFPDCEGLINKQRYKAPICEEA